MPIDKKTGSKFFEDSYTLFRDGVTATATTGNVSAKNLLNLNKDIRWQSVGSNDSITETVTITLPTAKTISRIYMSNHNLKQYTITYGAGNTNFTNVVGLDGPLGGGISETVYAKNASYYEFTPVTTTILKINAVKTQIAAQEKYIAVFVATQEIGTFTLPFDVSPRLARNPRTASTLSGKQIIQKNYEMFSASINLPMLSNQSDVDLVEALHLRETPFLFWPCGGHYGSSYFRVNLRSWRLEDIYRCQMTSTLGNDFYKNLYTTFAVGNINLQEVV